MKVLLIGFTKIAYMPYMHFYINELKKNNCEIDLIYWKRDVKEDIKAPDGVSTYRFQFEQEDSLPLIKKTKGFFKYRKYTKSILEKNKYDLVIVLHSTPGVLLFDLLQKEYRGKYILDYRDFTYENIKIYKSIIHKLVNNSICTFVSSDAYRKYLPERDNIYTSHNLLIDSLKDRDKFIKDVKNIEKIRIRFWGLIRNKMINISIIDKVGNDKRFELHYHGREQETAKYLKKYCEDNQIKNVFFHGEYKPEERYEFAKNTDIIHNLYENDSTMINAMSNKYYDGIIFYIPQLCTEGSFMANEVKLRNIGFVINPYSESFADNIYDYYKSIKLEELNTNCNVALSEIIRDYKKGTSKISEVLKVRKGD